MDNVCNRCLFSIPSKVEMAEEQEYKRGNCNFYDYHSYRNSTQGRHLTKFNTERLCPEVQPVTLLYTILAEKLPLLYTFYGQKVPLSHTYFRALYLLSKPS